MPQHNFGYTAAASVNTPAASYAALYFDATGIPKYKDPAGIHHPLGGLSGWYDVTAYGFLGDDSTDNASLWSAFYSSLPSNAIVYFPPGTYRFSAELTINADKHIRFIGAGKVRSTIKATNATMHIFNITATAWYNTFEDLGFTSNQTATAGAAIAVGAASAIGIDVRSCQFTNMFRGIHFSGAQAGNLSVLDSLDMGTPAVNGTGVKIDGSTINIVISNSTINFGAAGSAVAGTKNIEINQCGAVQIVGCDIIGGVNALHINATNIVAAVYVNNTFFDQSGGSTVKISGSSSSSRIKFSQCGIAAGLNSTHALEINGTGAGAAGTSTALPAGIDVMDCDMYFAAGSSSGNGIQVNGCQDFTVRNCRITGFSSGINVATGNSGTTRFSIVDNTFGPNENLTITNATDVTVANSGTYGSYQIRRNTFGGTIKLADSGVLAAGAQKQIADNPGLANGTSAIGADQSIAVTTEVITTGLSLNIPANGMRVGTAFRVRLICISTNVNAITPRVRIGPTGAITETIVMNTVPNNITPVINAVITAEILVTVKTTGSTGTARGQYHATIDTGAATTHGGSVSAASAATLNTTVSNVLIVTLQQATAGATTIIGGSIEVVQQ